MTVSFLDLPPEVHSHVSHFLHPRQLAPICLASRACFANYSRTLDTHLCLDGAFEASRYFQKHREHARKLHFCSHGHPIKPQSPVDCSPPPKRPLPDKLDSISSLELYDVGPIYDDVHPFSPPHIAAATTYPGHLIGATLSLFSPTALRTLLVHQSPFPLNATLAYAISEWAPRLTRLSFRAHCVDASSLGRLVETLIELEDLEVGSVKTCWCRGHEGRAEGAKDLAGAIAAAKGLKRLTMHSSNVLTVESGVFFDVLAGRHKKSSCPAHGDDGAASTSDSSGLKSLELRRSPVPGRALARYLASPAAGSLQRLFIGGCKDVRAGHLASALAPHNAPERCAFTSSDGPLHLEVDGRLISSDVLAAIGHRIVFLRLYQPDAVHCKLVGEAAQKGQLSRCSHIVVVPSGDDEEEDVVGIRADWTSSLQGTDVDVSVGDEAWRSMRRDLDERRAWAEAIARGDDRLVAGGDALDGQLSATAPTQPRFVDGATSSSSSTSPSPSPPPTSPAPAKRRRSSSGNPRSRRRGRHASHHQAHQRYRSANTQTVTTANVTSWDAWGAGGGIDVWRD
ncbi:hypothetical protein BDZ90DRAFT_176030 [Jaminaea rosea]|uniref:F-box domain-containing protein n=1 Tax=Jaminaea rosea TaxID=1569628 RepID=A0A316UTV9_9BASI|nr:hypothetical protein BDZ90DRAFT_176030 [Jaminaea rosea]PWN27343.1 hypothetical protein BDZ90DRAFT_176030 [Jaminaea rosea]